jgi:hypothetical protein
MTDGYGGSNDNHLTNGTYDDTERGCCICGKPMLAEDTVDVGEFSRAHRGCRDTAAVEFEYKTLDGEPITDHRCIMPDHRETVLTLTIRTIGGLSVERVRHLIEKEFEVLTLAPTGGTIYAKN